MNRINIAHHKDAQKIPGFLLWKLSKLWQRNLNTALHPHGIASTQFVILGNTVRLTQDQKKVSQVMLSEETQVDPMTTSHALRSLEKKQLIKRIAHPIDKRAYHIVPTEKGVTLIIEALKSIQIAHRHFFSPVEKDLDLLVSLMNKLIDTNTL